MSGVSVLLAPGFEEIEAVSVIDVLRRAGVDTTVLGVSSSPVEGAHGISIEVDGMLADHLASDWDAIVLPGGMPGSAHLRDDSSVQAVLKRQQQRGGILAAICAGPIALSAAGVLKGRRATCYPGFSEQLDCGQHTEEPVVFDDGVLTSRGPGTALQFALRLVAELQGATSAKTLGERMLVRGP